MMGSPARWLFRVLFRFMAYRVPRLEVPERGVMLDDVIVVNPGAGRVRCSLGVAGDRIAQLVPRPLDTPATAGHSLHAGFRPARLDRYACSYSAAGPRAGQHVVLGSWCHDGSRGRRR